ncbi:oysgedart isoform a [Anaeramoeba flamelloides]|uniref:Oysgedart isoform a n=1 Tax=Anaeramoeba flamelloides TaxID=1746091 RepID=A0AAV7ZH67_9EUKA|nr:oysgedart isoform a [Anaeramoeba flamelloides]
MNIVDYIDKPFEILSDLLNHGSDIIKVTFCMLLAYPLSLVLKKIKDPKKRLWYSLILGVVFLVFVHRGQTIWVFAPCVILYYVLKWKPLNPHYFFVGAIFYLLFFHVHDLVTSYLQYCLKIRTTVMIQVVLYTSFVYNYYDGKTKKKSELTESQQRLVITEMPPLLDFLAYFLQFNTILIGPTYEYVHFENYMYNRSIEQAKKEFKKKHSNIKIGKDNSTSTGLKTLGISTAFCAMYLFFGMKFPNSLLFDEAQKKKNFLYRVLLTHIVTIKTRFKYYHALLLAEGSCQMSGSTFNGIDEKTGAFKWNLVENMKPFTIETAPSIYIASGVWNKRISIWLRLYIYNRIIKTKEIEIENKKGEKQKRVIREREGLATLLTFVVSAVWHGVYPGYYFTFILWFVVTLAGRSLRRNIRPFFVTDDGKAIQPFKKIYDVAGHIFTPLLIDNIGLPLIVFTFSKSIKVFQFGNFWVLWTTIPVIVITKIPICVKLLKKMRNNWVKLFTKANKKND